MIPLGGCIELAQMLVPRRTADLRDMLANILGVLTGVLLALLLRTAQRIRTP